MISVGMLSGAGAALLLHCLMHFSALLLLGVLLCMILLCHEWLLCFLYTVVAWFVFFVFCFFLLGLGHPIVACLSILLISVLLVSMGSAFHLGLRCGRVVVCICF